jgi:hypothetical protein
VEAELAGSPLGIGGHRNDHVALRQRNARRQREAEGFHGLRLAGGVVVAGQQHLALVAERLVEVDAQRVDAGRWRRIDAVGEVDLRTVQAVAADLGKVLHAVRAGIGIACVVRGAAECHPTASSRMREVEADAGVAEHGVANDLDTAQREPALDHRDRAQSGTVCRLRDTGGEHIPLPRPSAADQHAMCAG